MDFYKYHGAGNDFIIVDNRMEALSQKQLQKEFVASLCERHKGIGADGFMLLETSSKYDFSMRYFNSDGNESTMCGNGGRCIVKFADYLGIIQHTTRFEAVDGIHDAGIKHLSDSVSWVRLKMNDVKEIIEKNNHFILNTGSPHFVGFYDTVKPINVQEEGRKIRYGNAFMEAGINVNFVSQTPHGLFVRTYERGVEDETLSCGTGVTASALAFATKNNIQKGSITIETLGGNLNVSFIRQNNEFKDIWLEGEATFVFKGTITI